jgi:hypothetical protein
LKARCDVGDVFYLDEELTEKIEDVVEFFWSISHPNECKPKQDG